MSCHDTRASHPNLTLACLYTYRGHFAVVKLGMPKDGGPKVAIKIVEKTSTRFDAYRLEQEIEIMKRVNHPNCIKLHDVFNEQDCVCLVLDLATGGELFDRIIARGHYSEKDAAHATHSILMAVEYVPALSTMPDNEKYDLRKCRFRTQTSSPLLGCM
jgi:serine/threonine protein kinase